MFNSTPYGSMSSHPSREVHGMHRRLVQMVQAKVHAKDPVHVGTEPLARLYNPRPPTTPPPWRLMPIGTRPPKRVQIQMLKPRPPRTPPPRWLLSRSARTLYKGPRERELPVYSTCLSQRPVHKGEEQQICRNRSPKALRQSAWCTKCSKRTMNGAFTEPRGEEHQRTWNDTVNMPEYEEDVASPTQSELEEWLTMLEQHQPRRT